jgi:hypothetical protein
MNRIPLSGLSTLVSEVRRSRRLRFALVGAAVAAALLVLALAPRAAQPRDPLLGSGSSTIVVVDVSASISWDTYARIALTLDRLRRSGSRVGLVLFSDTAYLALPPRTRAAELAAFERFFVVKPPTEPGFQPQPPQSPWTNDFSGGTRISTGLSLALDELRAAHLPHPRVVLVSDLDDDQTDRESLTSVALAYRHLGVPIAIAALNPSPQDQEYMRRLLPSGSSIVDVPLTTQPLRGARLGLPWWSAVGGILLALALGAAALVTQRLLWANA